MDVNRLTTKSQEALQQAQSKAMSFSHAEVDGEHLLLALLDDPDGFVPRLLERANVDAGELRDDVVADHQPTNRRRLSDSNVRRRTRRTPNHQPEPVKIFEAGGFS